MDLPPSLRHVHSRSGRANSQVKTVSKEMVSRTLVSTTVGVGDELFKDTEVESRVTTERQRILVTWIVPPVCECPSYGTG
jgi:hypothetical protein